MSTQKPRPGVLAGLSRRAAAKLYLQTQSPIVWYKRNLWVWRKDKGYYSKEDRETFQFEVLKWLTDNDEWSEDTDAAKTLSQIISLSLRPSEHDMPFLLKDPSAHKDRITFANGTLDIQRWMSGDHCFADSDPDWFSTNSTSYDYDPTATCPQWEAWLRERLEGDEESFEAIQQWFGYSMVPDVSQRVMLVLHGPSGTGKSTLLNVLSDVVGPRNVARFSLAQLARGRFAGADLPGKLLNIANEGSELTRAEVENLKSWISAEAQQVEDKGKPTWTLVPTTRFAVAMNGIPEVPDEGQAWTQRFLLVPFRKPIPFGGQRFAVGENLKAELPGIANWALQGLRTLRKTGRITLPQAGLLELEEARADLDPFRSFITDEVTLTRQYYDTVTHGELKSRWEHRKSREGLDADYNPIKVGRLLQEMYHIKSEPRRKNGKVCRCLFGVRLSADQVASGGGKPSISAPTSGGDQRSAAQTPPVMSAREREPPLQRSYAGPLASR